MRRTYDRDRYMKRVEMIREHVPDCAITTDIIVGFPGETEEDFQQTLEVVDEVGYDSAFTFVFSPRRGTEAADAARTRSRTRSSASAWSGSSSSCSAGRSSAASRFVGTTQEVLVEGPSRTDPARLRGRTRHNKTVNFTGLAQPGELVDVEITGGDLDHARGRGVAAVSRADADVPDCAAAIAIFGPTAVGKTEVAIELADLLRERGRAAGRGLGGRLPGLRGPRRADRQAERRASLTGSSTG